MHTRRYIFALVLMLAAAAAQLSARAATNFNVSNSGATAYLIDGVSNETLTLVRGQSYTFSVSSTGHPFWVTTARGASSASANAFPGVTNNGMAPASGNPPIAISFTVPSSAPNTLFYQCGIHDAMGGTLNISDPAVVPAAGTIPLVGLGALLVAAALVIIRRRVSRS